MSNENEFNKIGAFIKRGDVAGLKKIISNGANVNLVSPNGQFTVLIGAVSLGKLDEAIHMEVITLLLDSGALVNQGAPNGNTALEMALQGYHEVDPSKKEQLKKVVFLLLQRGAHSNKNNENNMAPLSLIVENNSFELIKPLILDFHADPNCTVTVETDDFILEVPLLSYACIQGKLACVIKLLHNGAEVNKLSKGGLNALQLMGFKKMESKLKAAIIEVLLKAGIEKGVPHGSNDLLPLLIAIREFDSVFVTTLIKYHVETNEKIFFKNKTMSTPLVAAIDSNPKNKEEEEAQKKIIEALLENGADPNQKIICKPAYLIDIDPILQSLLFLETTYLAMKRVCPV